MTTNLLDNEENILNPVGEEIEDITMECPSTVGVELPTQSDVCVADTPVEIVNSVDSKSTITLGEYLGTLQESVVSIWKYHLHTRKHFIHVELDSLYHIMLSLVDTLIEQYMGCVQGVLSTSDYVNVLYVCDDKSELTFLNELRNFVIDGRSLVFSESLTEIWSTIDDIIGALDSTIYKLSAFSECEPIQTFEAFCYEHFNSLNENYDDEEEE